MTKIFDLRRRVSRDNREYRPGECAHRHINLDSHGGIVTCVNCKATLSPFWALTMLSGQYELALANIARLTARLTLADERIAAFSAETAAAQPRSKDAAKSDDRGLD
jgi:hypothetical protein